MPVRKMQAQAQEQAPENQPAKRPRTRASARAASQGKPYPQTPHSQQQKQQSQIQSVFRHHLQQVQKIGSDSLNYLLQIQPEQKLMLVGVCLVILLFSLFGLRHSTSSANTSTSMSLSDYSTRNNTDGLRHSGIVTSPTPISMSSHRLDSSRKSVSDSLHLSRICQAYTQLYTSGPWDLATGTSDPPLTLFAVLDIDINAPPFSAFFFSSDTAPATGSLPQPYTLDSKPWRIAVSSAFDAALKRLEDEAGTGGRGETASWSEILREKEAEDDDEWRRRWDAKHGLGLAYNVVREVGSAVMYVREFLVWDKKERRWKGVKRKKLEGACQSLKELR